MTRILILFLIVVSLARGEVSTLDLRIAFLLGVHSPYANTHACDGFFPVEKVAASRFEAISKAVLRDDPKRRWKTIAEIRTWLDKCHAENEPGITDVLTRALGEPTGEEPSLRMAYLVGVHARHPGKDAFQITDRKKASYVFRLLTDLRVSVRLSMDSGIPGGTTITVYDGDDLSSPHRFFMRLETIDSEL